MQGAVQGFFSRAGLLTKTSLLHHVRVLNPALRPLVFSRSESVSPARIEEHGFENTTIADVLTSKGKGADGSWLWCTVEDSVYDAVQSMTQHNVGALVVVKPGQQKSIAGIITERDYLRKIIVQGRSSKSTKVGDIMTEENKLITVTPDTKVLRAMQLMTGTIYATICLSSWFWFLVFRVFGNWNCWQITASGTSLSSTTRECSAWCP
ncbi:CBS domain-containing protein CBSX3, mitochondrial [Linum grandiflorum]